jgi:hypothetical protein
MTVRLEAQVRRRGSSRRFSRVEGAFYVSDRVALRFISTAIRARETLT